METNLILIIGGSSFLGKKLHKVLSESFTVISTYHKHPLPSGVQLNILNREEVTKLLRKHNAGSIILLAGYTDVDECQANKDLCWKLNVEAARPVIEHCQRRRVKLIYFSSDYVFNGRSPPYHKSDERLPLSFYGLVKAAVEDMILKRLDNFLIFRLDVLYGYNDQSDKVTYPIKVINKLKQGKPIKAENSRVRYPTLTDDVAFLVKDQIKNDKTGLIQASSSEGATRYEWALKTAEVFNLNENLIEPFRGKFRIKPHDPRMILDSDVNFHTLEEGLRIMKGQMKK